MFGSAAVAAVCGLAAAIPAVTASAAPLGPPATASDGYDAGVIIAGPIESQLTAAYTAARGIPAADIAGVAVDSLAQASVDSTQWAIASFLPTLSDSDAVLARFQDAADTAVFSSGADGQWKLVNLGGGLSCPGVLPAAVQQALGLADPTGCTDSAALAVDAATAKVSTGRIAAIAHNNVGLKDDPNSTNFNFDCNPFTAMVGVGAPSSGCGRNAKFKILDQSELWCSDFAKWVWRTAGEKSDLNVLTPSAATFYAWGSKHKEALPKDSKSFSAGDAIVFFPPGGETTFADHVGLIEGVDKANGTVDIVNGDFLSSSGIEVQNNVVKISGLQKWADQVWQRSAKNPERWYLVSPNG